MNEKTLKKCIIDIVEYGIWDIGENHGKIKRWAIDKLSKMVDDIPPNATLLAPCTRTAGAVGAFA